MSNPLEVFFCYAHADQKMLALLKRYLTPLQRLDQITLWDLNEGPGWAEEHHQHLESAHIILLLISPDFLASDYCYTQMERAIQRHEQGSSVAVPIILRPTYWKNMPFAQLRVLPGNALPLTKWPDQDDAFLDILRAIEQIVVKFQSR